MVDNRTDIMLRLLSNIDDKYDKTEGSFFYDTQKPVSIELEGLYQRIENMLSNAFVSTATGTYLDDKLAEVGMTRLTATYATGNVTFYGTEGTFIESGVQVKSDALTFTIENSGTIDANGYVTLTALCNTAGTIGNVPVGAINGCTVSINGVISVSNSEAFSGGYNEETDAEARVRYYATVRKPVTSGNKYQYEEWAREASSGVGDARCIPLWDNDPESTPGEVAGNVTVLILDDNMEPAGSDLINIVQTYIEERQIIGAKLTTAAAEALTINVSCTLILADGYSETFVISSIENAIKDYLKNIAFSQNTVSYAKIGNCIFSTVGVLDYTDLTVNSGTSNIVIDDNKVPVMGVFTNVQSA